MLTRLGMGVGGLIGFRVAAHHFLLNQARRQGDLAGFRLGSRPAFLVSHPDLVREVLVDRAAEFGKGYLLQRAKALLGEGLLTLEGEQHRLARRQLQPCFARPGLEAHQTVIDGCLTSFRAGWTPGAALQVVPAAESITMELMARFLFGTELGDDGPAIRRDLALLGRWFPLLSLPGAKRFEGWPVIRRATGALARFDATIRRRARIASPTSLLGRMAGAMTEQQLRDHVVTLFLAGFDTTAAAIGWTFHLLSTHPSVARGVRDDPALAEPVVSETLRLYPPIIRMGRRALHDLTLGGRRIPRGAVVFVSPYVTQRDHRWFPEPERFLPERWVSPNGPPSPFAYFPFGRGTRACIGEHLARRALVSATKLVARCRWIPVDPRPRREHSFLTLKPNRTLRLVPVPWTG